MQYLAHQRSEFYPAGVYGIFSLSGDGLYIGCTNDTRSRFSAHLNDLRANRHHCQALQDYFNQQGETDFVFSVMDSCPAETSRRELLDLESEHLRRFENNKAFRILNYAISKEPRRATVDQPGLTAEEFAKNVCDTYPAMQVIEAMVELGVGHFHQYRPLTEDELRYLVIVCDFTLKVLKK